MAVETVVKTVATSGKTYSTWQAWEDDAPANLTTAERWSAGSFSGTFTQGETVTGTGLTAGKFLDSDGSSYVTFGIVTGNSATLTVLTGSTSGATCTVSSKTHTGVIWQGQGYKTGEFTSSSTIVTLGGSTTSSTCYKEMTAASGESFQDHASVRTNALTYNSSLGVALRLTSNYVGNCITGSDNNWRCSRLQLKCPQGNYTIKHATGTGAITVKDMICHTNASSTSEFTSFASANPVVCANVLWITEATGTSPMVKYSGATGTIIGCTIARTQNRTPAGTGFTSTYGTITMQSTAIFGFTTPVSLGTGGSSSNSKNNGTDQASMAYGTSLQTSITYGANSPFTVGAATSNNMITVTGTNLSANGFLDSTNAPNDISGYARASGPTIGCWELTATATGPRRLAMMGVG